MLLHLEVFGAPHSLRSVLLCEVVSSPSAFPTQTKQKQCHVITVSTTLKERERERELATFIQSKEPFSYSYSSPFRSDEISSNIRPFPSSIKMLY
jgi:hypothetical protein